MKKSIKLFAISLLIVPLILAFNFNEKNESNTLYKVNEEGEICINNVELYKEFLEVKFQEEEGRAIKIDKITAGKQFIKDGFVRRVFTASSPDLEEGLSFVAVGVYNSSNPNPVDIDDYVCTRSVNCPGCEPYWTGTRYRCSPCGAPFGFCWGHPPFS